MTTPFNDGRRGRVLVVDDDPDVRRAVQGVLEDEGLLVDSAADGASALEAAALQPPQLVVLDITLPDDSGHHLARQLRGAHGASLLILVITADGGAARKARDVGAFAYLRKPFELTDLVDMVHRALAGTRDT